MWCGGSGGSWCYANFVLFNKNLNIVAFARINSWFIACTIRILEITSRCCPNALSKARGRSIPASFYFCKLNFTCLSNLRFYCPTFF